MVNLLPLEEVARAVEDDCNTLLLQATSARVVKSVSRNLHSFDTSPIHVHSSIPQCYTAIRRKNDGLLCQRVQMKADQRAILEQGGHNKHQPSTRERCTRAPCRTNDNVADAATVVSALAKEVTGILHMATSADVDTETNRSSDTSPSVVCCQ